MCHYVFGWTSLAANAYVLWSMFRFRLHNQHLCGNFPQWEAIWWTRDFWRYYIYFFLAHMRAHTHKHTHTHTHRHTQGHTPFLTPSLDCRFFRTKSSLGSVEWQPFISTQLHIKDQPTVLTMVHWPCNQQKRFQDKIHRYLCVYVFRGCSLCGFLCHYLKCSIVFLFFCIPLFFMLADLQLW